MYLGEIRLLAVPRKERRPRVEKGDINKERLELSERGYAVIGLGFVGLPVALALAERFETVCGFDISEQRISELRQAKDRTREAGESELRATTLRLTNRVDDLTAASFFIVTVPTPIDSGRRPDLGPIRAACDIIGRALRPGAVVVFESTVYPGLTRGVGGPLLAAASGLRQGIDLNSGIRPSASIPATGFTGWTLSSKWCRARMRNARARRRGLFQTRFRRRPSRIEHRGGRSREGYREHAARPQYRFDDELAIIFDRLGISTADVLEAAGTKCIFLRFSPGLVGGHCIGVHPYDLTARAEAVGYYPQVILSGRRINDGMGAVVAQRLIKLLITTERRIKGVRVGILGLTFKEDVPDLRNSRVPDIIVELRGYGIFPIVHDPIADHVEAWHEYGVELVETDSFTELYSVIYAVPHRIIRERGDAFVYSMLASGGTVIDVKSAIDRARVPPDVAYWAL